VDPCRRCRSSAALLLHLPPRWRFVWRARAGRRLLRSSASLDLFALRVLAQPPLHRLAAISDDPAAAWRAGDADVTGQLAALELEALGLRVQGRRRAGRD